MRASSRFFMILATLVLVTSLTACGKSGSSSPDGDTPDGDTTDGDTSDGDTPDGDEDGDTPDGDEDGDIPDGDTTDGDEDGDTNPDGDTSDGDEDGDTPDGDEDGDTPDGDEDGDTPDGDEDGDTDSDGDTSDGDEDGDTDADADGDLEEDAEEESPICGADVSISRDTLPHTTTYTTVGALNNSNTSCGPRNYNGPDVVFEVYLNALDLLEVVVTPQDPVNLAVYIATSCIYGGGCLAIADEAGTDPETLRIRVSQTGFYTVVVDSAAATGTTSFQIAMRLLSNGTAAPGDLCTGDQTCNPTAGAGSGFCLGTGSVSACSSACTENSDCTGVGFLSGCCLPVERLGGSYCHVSQYCGALGRTALPGQVCATSETPNRPLCDPLAGAVGCLESTQEPGYCTKTCTTEEDCGAFSNPCCVDTGFSYSLCLHDLDCAAPCAAEELLMGDDDFFSLTGSLHGQHSRVNALSCEPGGTGGEDYSYTLAIPSDTFVTVTVTPLEPWNPVLLVTDSCGWLDAPDACLAAVNDAGVAQPEVLHFAVTEGGFYRIVVDSKTYGEGGDYELDIRFGEIPDGDIDDDEEGEQEEDGDEEPTCTPTRSYTRDELPVSFSDLTYGLDNNMYLNTGCSGAEQTPAIDYITAVSLDAGDTLYVTLTPTAPPAWNPALMIYSGCEAAACQMFADSGLTGMAESLVFTADSAGTYFVVVDSTVDTAVGNFTLALSLDDNVDGDEDGDEDGEDPSLCEPDDVVGDLSNLPYIVSDDTTGGVDKVNLAPTVEPGCFSWGIPGPDHVYALTLEAGQAIEVALTDVGENYDVALVISESCSQEMVCLAGSDDGGMGEGEYVLFIAPHDGTFLIVVDSPRSAQDPRPYYAAQSAGAYTLTIAPTE